MGETNRNINCYFNAERRDCPVIGSSSYDNSPRASEC